MATIVKDLDSESLDTGALDEYEPGAAPSRVVINREHPPSKIAVLIKAEDDTKLGRWAEDESSVENVLANATKTGDMPGGHGDSGCSLARDPRRSYPDLASFSKVEWQGAGGERLWSGTLRQQPQSEGDRISIEPKAVGDKQFLEDDPTVVGPGFISRDLSRWTGPSAARRRALNEANASNLSDPGVIYGEEGSELRLTVSGGWESPQIPRCEAWFDTGGPEILIGRVISNWKGPGTDFNWGLERRVAQTDAAGNTEGTADLYTETVTGTDDFTPLGPRRYVFYAFGYNVTDNGIPGTEYPMSLTNLTVIGNQGLVLQDEGGWPHVGFFAKQMIPFIAAQAGLTTNPELLDDDEFIIPQAWFDAPGTPGSKLVEVTKYGLLDWFVFNDRVLQYRIP